MLMPDLSSGSENGLTLWSCMSYYVYVILCDDGSFYTGYTRNVNARMRLHMNGRGAKYTRMHRPKRLVYEEEFGSKAEAMKRERRLKRMRHDEKARLIKARAQVVRRTGHRGRQ